MKLATFSIGASGARVGLISAAQDAVLDLAAGATRPGPFGDMIELMRSGATGLDQVNDIAERTGYSGQHWHALGDVTLLAPIPRPTQLRDFAGFEGHLKDGAHGLMKLLAAEKGLPLPNAPAELPEPMRKYPLYYFQNRMNVIGPDARVGWPDYIGKLDFELEIGACIGVDARNVRREDAGSYIFGFTIYNDVSGRDVQSRQMPGGLGPCKAKSFDAGNVIGPWIVTRDELPDPYGRMGRVRVNGETWAEAPAVGTVHDFAEMIMFASEGETIHAGEVLGSGTISGCCGLEMDRWIKRGDVVDLEFEGIGTLRNVYG